MFLQTRSTVIDILVGSLLLFSASLDAKPSIKPDIKPGIKPSTNPGIKPSQKLSRKPSAKPSSKPSMEAFHQDNPRKAYGWSKYRYTRYDVTPQTTDVDHAILAGGDVKCKVCEIILQDLFGTGESKDYDSIEDALVADSVTEEAIEKAENEMERFVVKHKKGCNKLYKDNFLAHGWTITNCTRLAEGQNASTPKAARAAWACVEKSSNKPSDQELKTHSIPKEAAHYACQVTIERNRDELAEYLAEQFKKPHSRDTQSVKELYEFACRKPGKCLVRGEKESPTERVKKMEKRLHSAENDVLHQLMKEANLSKADMKMYGAYANAARHKRGDITIQERLDKEEL